MFLFIGNYLWFLFTVLLLNDSHTAWQPSGILFCNARLISCSNAPKSLSNSCEIFHAHARFYCCTAIMHCVRGGIESVSLLATHRGFVELKLKRGNFNSVLLCRPRNFELLKLYLLVSVHIPLNVINCCSSFSFSLLVLVSNSILLIGHGIVQS